MTPAGGGALGARSDAVCPRCAGVFHCGRDDASPCACAGIALDADTLAALRSRYQGCLCVPCLRELARAKLSPTPRGIH